MPGTPSMAVSPSYSTAPAGVWTTASTVVEVLRLKIRTVVSPIVGRNQSGLDGEGADGGQHVAAVGLKSTKARSVETWAKR